MVARALAPVLTSEARRGGEPLRVFYRGDVIRCQGSRLGSNRELFQIGAELVGDASIDADIAMLKLAATIAATFTSKPLVVHTGAVQIDDPTFVVHTDDDADRGYYTGLRFWVYGDDRRTPIAQGGRYDSLYARFGADAPAVGFTFTVD
jgi:ATP phosphoribosyltransferase regulatory subunit HisZ